MTEATSNGSSPLSFVRQYWVILMESARLRSMRARHVLCDGGESRLACWFYGVVDAHVKSSAAAADLPVSR
jgi:hypothetical protein